MQEARVYSHGGVGRLISPEEAMDMCEAAERMLRAEVGRLWGGRAAAAVAVVNRGCALEGRVRGGAVPDVEAPPGVPTPPPHTHMQPLSRVEPHAKRCKNRLKKQN